MLEAPPQRTDVPRDTLTAEPRGDVGIGCTLPKTIIPNPDISISTHTFSGAVGLLVGRACCTLGTNLKLMIVELVLVDTNDACQVVGA